MKELLIKRIINKIQEIGLDIMLYKYQILFWQRQTKSTDVKIEDKLIERIQELEDERKSWNELLHFIKAS